MKILLVSINSQYIHQNNAPYILLSGVEHYFKDVYEKNEFEILNANINEYYWKMLNNILDKNADVYAFSCYIWNVELVKKLITDIKNFNANAKIIVGGPESYSMDNYFTQNELVDIVLIGSGEYIFGKAILNLITDDIPENKTLLESDFCDKFLFEQEKEMNFRALTRCIENNKNDIFYFETSRGCPFSCAYCMASLSKKVQYLSLPHIYKCIDFINTQHYKIIKVCDRTFNSNVKRMNDILTYISKLPNTNQCWHFEVAVHLFNEQSFEILANMPRGVVQFEVGVQSFNSEVLNIVSRHIDKEKTIENLSRLIMLDKAMVHTDLIAGLPLENLDSFIEGFNLLHKMLPNEIQLGFLKVLGKTEIAHMTKEYGIVFSKFPPYQVLKTNSMSHDDLIFLELIEGWVEALWNSNKFTKFVKFMLETKYVDNPFGFYESLVKFNQFQALQSQNSIKIAQVLAEYIKKEYDEEEWIGMALENICIDIYETTHKAYPPSNIVINNKSPLSYKEKLLHAAELFGYECQDFSKLKREISVLDLPSGKICAINRLDRDIISNRYKSVIF